MSFLTVRKSDTETINAHFKKCQHEEIPFVLCKTRRSKADVEFDFITLNYELEAKIEARAEEVKKRAMEIFEKYANKGASYQLSAKVMFFRDLDFASAEAVAQDLYSYLCDVIGVTRQLGRTDEFQMPVLPRRKSSHD